MTAGGPWAGGTSVPAVPRRPGQGVDVWLVHPGPDPDYYETIFDFAALVAASRAGPVRLRVWTGRDDLDPAGLRATLRRIVTAEIEAARSQLAGADWEARDVRDLGYVLTLAASGAALALRASPAGLAVSALIAAAGLALGRTEPPGAEDAARLEAEIARTRAALDAALPGLRLRLHPELSGGPGDAEAWPIPGAVRALMAEAAPAR